MVYIKLIRRMRGGRKCKTVQTVTGCGRSHAEILSDVGGGGWLLPQQVKCLVNSGSLADI